MACSALRIALLLLTLRVAQAGRHNYCDDGFAEAEMEAEARQY